MWKIGNIEIEGRVVLAPMAGYTSLGYRKFMKPFGVALEYTEMVSDMGLIYDNLETKTYVDFPKQFPTGVQLFGNSPKTLAESALIAQKLNKNIDFFDVNMGCPVPKVTKPGSGSSLLKNPKLCCEIIKAIKEATGLPCTAKIRLGIDEKNINFKEVISELEKAGVDAIAIHARTKKELYTGLPHFDMLKNLRKEMNVPLIISGNIFTLDDAINAVEITGADAVMVARGGIGNPWLIKQIDAYFKTGEKLPPASLKENINFCRQLGQCLIEEKGEAVAMRLYRAMAPKFFVGIPNAKIIKNQLATQLVDKKSLENILNELEQNIE